MSADVPSRLPSITCPSCGRLIESDAFIPNSKGGAHIATTFESCLRRCMICGFGFSNANTNRVGQLTIIYLDPFWSLPSFMAEGYQTVLDQALNVGSRAKKAVRFRYSTSEDHVTWTICRYLHRSGGFRQVLAHTGIRLAGSASIEPTVLLWGVPFPLGDLNGKAVQQQLIGVVDALGEEQNSRSEPDVILDFGTEGVVFMEVKHRSENKPEPHNTHWPTYLQATAAFRNGGLVQATGHYELARNWRIAWEMAADLRPMAVVNLGPVGLFRGQEGQRVDSFAAAINQDDRHQFLKVEWGQVFQGMPNQPLFIQTYLRERAVV